MPVNELLASARSAWEKLTGVTVSFGSCGRATVVVAAGSKLCPPSWTGIAVLGDGALVTVPSDPDRQRFLSATTEVTTSDFAEPEAIRSVLPVIDVLGPAHLAYTDRNHFQPTMTASADVEAIAVDHTDVRRLLDSVIPAEAEESAIAAITSPVFVGRTNGAVVAASGYMVWAGIAAHICVLTAPDHRNQGHARTVASAAVEHALACDLLPQWRARPVASRRVARAIGFQEIGAQLSVRVAPAGSANDSV